MPIIYTTRDYLALALVSLFYLAGFLLVVLNWVNDDHPEVKHTTRRDIRIASYGDSILLHLED